MDVEHGCKITYAGVHSFIVLELEDSNVHHLSEVYLSLLWTVFGSSFQHLGTMGLAISELSEVSVETNKTRSRDIGKLPSQGGPESEPQGGPESEPQGGPESEPQDPPAPSSL